MTFAEYQKYQKNTFYFENINMFLFFTKSFFEIA